MSHDPTPSDAPSRPPEPPHRPRPGRPVAAAPAPSGPPVQPPGPTPEDVELDREVAAIMAPFQARQADNSALLTEKVDLDADLEQQIEAVMKGVTAAPKGGDRDPIDLDENLDKAHRARVIAIRGDSAFVSLGGRDEGIVPLAQFEGNPPAVGSVIDVSLHHYDAAEGLWILSRRGAAVEADWSTLQEGQVVEGRVTGTNKGGLELDVNGIRGFMPASQIDLVRVMDLETLVGERLRAVVTEASKADKRLVLSRRQVLEQQRREARDKTWSELAEGQVRTGTVQRVEKFGAFVDLGGIDGLLPVGEMSYARVANPLDVVSPGQTIQVKVLKIDRDNRRITLGLKQLGPDPWDEVVRKFSPRMVVPGTVTRTAEFGAFVELEPGIEGLVHLSELANRRIRRTSDVVSPGQPVTVRILKVDKEQHRIALSMRNLPAEEAEAEPESSEAPVEEPRPAPPPRKVPLKGGLGPGGDLFPRPPSAQ